MAFNLVAFSLATSLDVIARFRASRMPLHLVSQDIFKKNRLGPKERHLVLSFAFAWVRNIFLVEAFFKEHEGYGFFAFSRRHKDLIIIFLNADDISAESVEKIGAIPKPQLASLQRDYQAWLLKLGSKKSLYFLPKWFQKKIIQQWGAEAEEVAKGLSNRAHPVLALYQSDISRKMVVDELQKLGFQTSESLLYSPALKIDSERFRLDLLPPLIKNQVWLMDDSSQYAASLVKPESHEKVLDMCAGEGGKTKLMAPYCADLTAVDIDQKRLEKAKKRIPGRINWQCVDATSKPFPNNSFDWIFLDAPCSGTGTLRRHPDLLFRLTEADLERVKLLQQQLLESAYSMLKPNGRLIYVTCSVLAEENEDAIKTVLKSHKQLTSFSLSHFYQRDIHPKSFPEFSIQLLPHIYGCDGMYIASMKKMQD